MAVNPGAKMINQRTLERSANVPIHGLISAGSCIAVDSRPAWVRVKESFSINSGSSGAKKLE